MRGHDFKLEELTFEITKKCPMNCIHCSSEGGVKANREFTLEEIKQIINQAIELGTNHINLSGGEPIVFPHFIDLCRFIKDKGLVLDVYSCGNQNENGSLTPLKENLFKELKEIEVDKIIFSIHSSIEPLHDQITKKSGSYSNLIFSIKKSVDFGLFTELHFVPTKINYRSLPEILKLARTLKVKCLSILRFVPQGRGRINKDILEIKDDDILKLKTILIDLRNNNQKEFLRIGSPFNCFQFPNSPVCTAGITKAIIKPDGYVYPCVSMKDFISDNDDNNLRRNNLVKIWTDTNLFNETRNSLQNIKQTSCDNCDKFTKCKGGCLTQNLLDAHNKDPYCMKRISNEVRLLS